MRGLWIRFRPFLPPPIQIKQLPKREKAQGYRQKLIPTEDESQTNQYRPG
jgi:hypothetical protein